MNSDRPSIREIHNRIRDAKQALDNNNGLFANICKAIGELSELEINDSAEVFPLIRRLLEEISASDYAGQRPPQKSYEAAIANRELFAFCWDSTLLKGKMYLKFSINNGRFYYVSLHASKTKR